MSELVEFLKARLDNDEERALPYAGHPAYREEWRP